MISLYYIKKLYTQSLRIYKAIGLFVMCIKSYEKKSYLCKKKKVSLINMYRINI